MPLLSDGPVTAPRAPSASRPSTGIARLQGVLARLPAGRASATPSGAALGAALDHLVAQEVDRLPLPGSGATLARWQALALVAAHDVALVKLFEGHTDALAILAELSAEALDAHRGRWGVWAAESRDARLDVTRGARGVRLDGVKAWCSGAAVLTDALVTAKDPTGRSQLVAVRLDHPGVRVTDRGWAAIGMADTGSVEVAFRDVPAALVGEPDAYLQRPGFWQGGAGIAACWHGGAAAIGAAVHAGLTPRESASEPRPIDPHAAAHLGAIDIALAANAALLREAAGAIDAHPHADAHRIALRTRLCAERTATEVMEHAGRALGAAAYCRDPALARRLTDLRVFVRQSHAERDLAALGASVAGNWTTTHGARSPSEATVEEVLPQWMP